MTRTMGALDGLRVVDLTRVLGGPYCTMILADHGADVVKVEPPQGDEVRDWGPPFLEHADGTRDASYFLGVNRNKRALALDLAQLAGREVLLRLLESADVLVENFKPGSLERWDLGYADVLAERFPRLIHCRLSGFGADGPLGRLPGYDVIVQAMCGLMSVNGEPDGGGVRIAMPVVDMGTGLYSAVGILMALHERTRSGLGQFLDMTLHDCGLALLHPQAANYLLGGQRPRPTGNDHPNIAPYSKFRTGGGDIVLAIGNDAQFRRLCAILGAPALAEDPRYTSNSARVANRPALTEALEVLLAAHDGATLADRLLRDGLPAGPVLAIDEALAAPHTIARGMVVEHDGVRTVATPIKLSRTPGETRSAPPRFAEHSEAVLAELGLDAADIASLERDGVIVERRRVGGR